MCKKPSFYHILIARLGDEKSFRFWCLPPIIRSILWGVDINILMFSHHQAEQSRKQNVLCTGFFCTPFTKLLVFARTKMTHCISATQLHTESPGAQGHQGWVKNSSLSFRSTFTVLQYKILFFSAQIYNHHSYVHEPSLSM